MASNLLSRGTKVVTRPSKVCKKIVKAFVPPIIPVSLIASRHDVC